jgi:ribosomal protein S18
LGLKELSDRIFNQTKKKNMKKKILLLVSALALIVLIATNPSREDHEKVIKGDLMETSNASSFGGFGYAILDRFSDKMIENRIEYKNYFIFSKMVSDQGKTMSTGFLGNVQGKD